MHDIKYFFLIKLIRQFEEGQKNFQRRTNYRKYYRKALFFKIQGRQSESAYVCTAYNPESRGQL
jgi:hypothetical protein